MIRAYLFRNFPMTSCQGQNYRSKLILWSNMIFATNQGKKSVIPLFRVISTSKFISDYIFKIQGQKVNFKVK